jgi:hypothetical protein
MWLIAGLLVAATALAAETGTALKSDDVKGEPFRDAKTVATIAKGDRVDILTRKGGWLQIKVGSKQGWVRMLSVRRGEAGKADAGKDASAIAGIATGRTGTGQVVSTTGVRGLGEEDLKQAKFDEAELKRFEAQRVSAQAAQQFARAGNLTAQKIAFLPEPKQAAQSETGDGGRN